MKVSSVLPDALISQVAAALGITALPVRQQSIAAGELNQVVKLSAGEQHWVVKLVGSQQATGVNVREQFALQLALSRHGIAPTPYWLSADADLWVEAWIPATVELLALPLPQRISLLAHALATVHAQPVPTKDPQLRLSQRWQHYLKMSNLSPQHPLWGEARALLQSESFAALEESSPCVCHHDLSFGHIISRSPVIIVDWEYAAYGYRFFDIACAIFINQLSDAATQMLCDAYAEFSGCQAAEVSVAVSQQLPIAKMTSDLWQLACVKEH